TSHRVTSAEAAGDEQSHGFGEDRHGPCVAHFRIPGHPRGGRARRPRGSRRDHGRTAIWRELPAPDGDGEAGAERAARRPGGPCGPEGGLDQARRPSSMNDGLLSGSLHFAAQGAPSLATLWEKTHGQIRGVSAMTTYPLYLVTRNPAVKTIKDFTSA